MNSIGSTDLVGRRPTFEDLIAPLSSERFLDEYWGKNFLHGRPSPGLFDGLFSANDIEHWARSTRNGFFFVLHPRDETVHIDSFQADTVDPSSLSSNYRRGLAQILKMVSDWPSLQGLVGHLGSFFHADVMVNVFWTPPGARSHPIYTCNNDVFVLQLAGEETWQLRELTVLQLDLPEKEHLELSSEWMNRHENPMLSEVSLKQGELLYIPRGMPHFAQSPERGMGLHLRIYVTTFTWVDFFKMAAEYAAIHSPGMRRSLPPGFVENADLSQPMATDFQGLMEEFRNVPFEAVLSAVRRNRVSYQGFPASDFVDRTNNLEDLGLDSEVERRPNVLCTVEETVDGDGHPRASLFFGKQRINGPSGLRRAFELVRNRRRFEIKELPGMDDDSRLLLTRRLIREGLLHVVG